MKYLSLILLIVFVGCKIAPNKKVIHDTIRNVDTVYLPYKPKDFAIGDTVILDVLGHGNQIGVIREFAKNEAYVDMLTCNCSAWYGFGMDDIRPFKQQWNKIIHK